MYKAVPWVEKEAEKDKKKQTSHPRKNPGSPSVGNGI